MSPPSPVARIVRRFQQGGMAGLLEAIKWKVFRHKDMVVAIRDVDIPLKTVPRHRCTGIYFRLATLDDIDIMSANFPHKRKWYRQRLETPGYFCDLAMFEDEVIAHNWFSTCTHIDPEMRCEITPSENQAYWFEGWCREEWRNRGVSNLGVKHCFEDLFPAMGITTVMTLLEENNVPTRRLHRRYNFEDSARRVHLRLGPIYWTSKPKPIKATQA